VIQTKSRAIALGSSLILAAFTAAGCATEEYVHETVAPVQAQAQQAQTTAQNAQATADEALQRANSAHKLAQGKFLYEVVLSDDSVKFPTNGDQLSPEAQARLTELVQKLKTDNRNVYLEIQGFTDSRGSPKRNKQLGEARAEAVREYLHKQGVALGRMATISYGEQDPVAPNDTPEGRAQNRRVTIVVLS
jgi:outer membrane protein OmpA-like peptidoglycan-associated protein